MRLDLFLSGAFFYRIGARDAQALFLLLQREGILPKALKRVKKNGDICFFLSSGDNARFVTAAKAEISSSRLIQTFQLLQTSVTKESTQLKAVRTVQVQERTAKRDRIS